MAFMKVWSDLLIILKNGSRTGNFSEPHNTVCSRMWATPVSSVGVVLKPRLKRLFESFRCMWKWRAPVEEFSSSYSAFKNSGPAPKFGHF